MPGYTVDRAAVETEVARRRRILETSYRRWFATKLVLSSVVLYALAFLILGLATKGPLTLTPATTAVFLGVPALMAVLATWTASRTLFRREALDADRVAREVAAEVEQLTGPTWPLRTVIAGAGLAAIAGVPVGLMLWVTKARLARNPTIGSLLIFVSGMLLWAILVAFIIRFVTLFLYRGMIRRDYIT
jgi:hypothetical protein